MQTDERGVWVWTPEHAKTKRGFRPKPPSDTTVRERRVAARHERNLCPTHRIALSLATGECGWC